MANNTTLNNILDYETFGDNNRSYFFDIKQARNNKHYLCITRRDATDQEKIYKRTHVIFFEDEIPFLVEALSMVLTRYTHSQMPHQIHQVMEQHLRIQEMNQSDRPREKLIAKGADALTNAELLAVLLGQGIPGHPILTVCKQLTESVGNDLSILARLTYADFCRIKGIGQAKALLLIAAMELGERRKLHENGLKMIRDEEQVMHLVRPYFSGSASPLWLLVLVNHRQELLATSEFNVRESGYPELPALLKLILGSGASGFWIARSPVNPGKDKSWLKDIQSGSKMLNLEFYGQVVIQPGG